MGFLLVALSRTAFLAAFLVPAYLGCQTPPLARPSKTAADFGNLPLSFEANDGQTDRSVKALAHGEGYTLFLRSKEAVLELRSPRSKDHANASASTVHLRLRGANPAAAVSQESRQITRTNYFIGHDPSQWHTDIPNYNRIRYRSVYPGIDLVYYGNQRQLEHDFIVAPNANPSAIQLTVEGASSLRLDGKSGELILDTAAGRLRLLKPVTYQKVDGVRRPVRSAYKLLAGNQIGFSIGPYDRARPLTIDPILLYSTYLGGSNQMYFGYYSGDAGNAITVNSKGEVYVTGSAFSQNFPVTSGSYQTLNKAARASNGDNAFISEFNSTGTALVFSTFLGGSGIGGGDGDSGQAIALDSSGNVYVAGSTYSFDFPVTTGALQTTNTNIYNSGTAYAQTGFVTKLNPKGNGLIYSTYLGGASIPNNVGNYPATQSAHALALDADGNAYITGGTNSPSFPVTAGAFQSSLHSSNAFVSKLNPQGTALVYSTYLGGSVGDQGNAIAVDSNGNAYIGGATSSPDFPVTTGAFQTVNHGPTNHTSNAFLTKLNPAGSAEVYSTFLGGSGQTVYQYPSYVYYGDSGSSLAIDSDGNAYLAGTAHSLDFPTVGGLGLAQYSTSGIGFVAKFSLDGSSVSYSTLIGGPYTSLHALAIDTLGAAYITGDTGGGFFPLSADALATQQTLDEDAIFIAKLNPTGNALQFSSLFGGTGIDNAQAIALDNMGVAYVTGSTDSSDFQITPGAFQSVNRAPSTYPASDAFVTAFSLSGETTDEYPVQTSITASAASVPQGSPITLTVKVTSAAPAPASGNVTLQYVPSITPVVALDDTGTATWTSSALAPGVYNPAVTYSGDSTHLTTAWPYSQVRFQVIGPPASITDPMGFYYAITYGEFSNLPIVVQIQDSGGNLLPGVTVHFSGTGFIFSAPSAVTNSAGEATVNFTAVQAGNLFINASVTGLSTSLQIPVNVGPAPLSVTLYDAWRTYGAANPDLPYAVSGLIGGDTVTVTASAGTTLSSPVGVYPITAMVTGRNIASYTVQIRPATLTIGKAPLYVSAANVSIPYGTMPPPLTKFGLSGFRNGDTTSVVSGAPVLTTTVTATSPVGAYRIGVQDGTLAAANYSFDDYSSGEGAVLVQKALLSIHPASYTIHAGDPLPAFTYMLSGFVNGETQATATTGAPVLYTTAPNPPTKGSYYIIANIGTLQARNYRFEENVPDYGILTVLP